MQAIRNVLFGTYGLAVTYWLWGVVGSLVVMVIAYSAVAVSAKFVHNAAIYNLLTYGSAVLSILWAVFVSVAIINASTYNRERGFWGWIATIIAGLGILRALYSAAVVVGLQSLSFSDIESSVAIENLGLPVEIEQGLTLDRMETNRSEQSLTYVYGFDYPTLNSETFDTTLAKEGTLESCEEFRDWLTGAVKKIVLVWRANDGTTQSIEILPEDCGF